MCYLRPMNAYEFDHYIDEAVKNYARELTKSGSCLEKDSLAVSQKAFSNLLPDGLETKGQFLFHILNETDAVIGMIWYGHRPNNEGFICDFSIDENFRGQGFGKKAIELIENEAKKHGIKKLSLHVFGHNFVAISLYKKLGYEIYSMNMSKEI
ncbi:MAG: GNAT family N-acetyltransferase [Acholeplasmataceae bacterium]|nr:GNAT family N-acetyltransferase [Acholeplasmataceae bacterium]